MIKALILDFDDTLCLTEEACFNLENLVLNKMNRDPMSRQIHKDTWGQPIYDAIQLRSPGIDVEEFFKLMPSVHNEFISKGHIDIVTDENLATLDRLIEAGIQLMILTSRTEVEVHHLLDPEHHLASRIASFYHKDNMKYHKPDPRAFEVIDQRSSLNPRECVYVGDSPSDAVSAKGAGLYFIATLESGLRTEDDFTGTPVDVFISKFTELDEAVSLLQ